jgi:hypothetical protein
VNPSKIVEASQFCCWGHFAGPRPPSRRAFRRPSPHGKDWLVIGLNLCFASWMVGLISLLLLTFIRAKENLKIVGFFSKAPL